MVVGVCQVDLRIPGNDSLKGKRKVLRRVIDRVKNRYNISISEIGDNDLWQRSLVGLSVVGNDARHVNSSLDKVLDFVERMNIVEIIHSEIEILHVHDHHG